MKHFYNFLLLLFVLPFYSLGQGNYKPGYIVSPKGDTIKGFIEYKEWERNPKEIQFKTTLNSNAAQVYNTNNTKAFGISEIEFYQRFILPISLDAVETNKLSPALDTTTRTDTIFLKVITNGKHLTLYSYEDDIKTRFYVLESGETQPYELTFHAYYSSSESNAVKYVNNYRGQLGYLVNKFGVGSDALSRTVSQIRYTRPDVLKIVQIINGPSGQHFTQQSQAGERMFIGIGLPYNSLKFTDNGGVSYQNANSTTVTSIYPKIDIGMDFFGNKNTQVLLIRLELSGTVNQYNIVYNNSTGTPQSTNTLKFSQYTASLIPQLILNVIKSTPIQLFIGAGAALNFSAYNKYQFITKYSGSFPEDVKDNYPALSGFWMSVPIQAGIVLNKKIEINLCYIPSVSITGDSTSPKANVTVYQLGLKYFFGK